MRSNSFLYFVASTLLLFLLSSFTAGEDFQKTNHAPTWTRAESFGGSGPDISSAVKSDTRGDQYVTGGFSSTARFGNKTFTSAGGTDIFLAKFGRSGELLWLIQAGGSGDDVGNDIALDREQNIYVAGSFTDSATFPSINGPSRTVTGAAETIFLAKYSPSGKLDWVQTGIGSSGGQNEAFGVDVNPETGAVFITGRGQENDTFSSSDGTVHTVPGVGSWHMFLVKYDHNGNFQWGQTNEAEANTVPHKVAADAHDNAYVTGWMEGTTTFHSNNGHDVTIDGFSPFQTTSDFPDDAFIAKYDAAGNAKWANHIGGYKGIAIDIAVSDRSEVSITGFIGNFPGSPEEAETIATSQPGGKDINLGGGQLTNPFNTDVFIATYNSAGVLLKALRFGGAQEEGGGGITYDHKGNLYVAGTFQNGIDVDGRSLTGKKPFNLFVLKFKSGTGGLDWAKKADGAGQDEFEANPRMLSVTQSGEVLVTGTFQGTAIFDKITLHSTQGDIFLAELNANRDHDGDKDDDDRTDHGGKD